VDQCDEHDHKGVHDRHSVQDEPFPKSESKDEVGAMIVGHSMPTNTKTFNMVPKL